MAGKPLYEEIFFWQKRTRWPELPRSKDYGFGCKSHLHTTKVLRLSEDLPIIIEIVDSEEKIEQFLPFLDEMVKEGLVTLEKANVIMYRGQMK